MGSTALRTKLGIVDSEKSPALQMTNIKAGLALTRTLNFLERSEKLVSNRILSDQRVLYKRLQARLAHTYLEDARRKGDKARERGLLAARAAPSLNTAVGGHSDVDAGLKKVLRRPLTAGPGTKRASHIYRPTKSAPCRHGAASKQDDLTKDSDGLDDVEGYQILDRQVQEVKGGRKGRYPVTSGDKHGTSRRLSADFPLRPRLKSAAVRRPSMPPNYLQDRQVESGSGKGDEPEVHSGIRSDRRQRPVTAFVTSHRTSPPSDVVDSGASSGIRRKHSQHGVHEDMGKDRKTVDWGKEKGDFESLESNSQSFLKLLTARPRARRVKSAVVHRHPSAIEQLEMEEKRNTGHFRAEHNNAKEGKKTSGDEDLEDGPGRVDSPSQRLVKEMRATISNGRASVGRDRRGSLGLGGPSRDGGDGEEWGDGGVGEAVIGSDSDGAAKVNDETVPVTSMTNSRGRPDSSSGKLPSSPPQAAPCNTPPPAINSAPSPPPDTHMVTSPHSPSPPHIAPSTQSPSHDDIAPSLTSPSPTPKSPLTPDIASSQHNPSSTLPSPTCDTDSPPNSPTLPAKTSETSIHSQCTSEQCIPVSGSTTSSITLPADPQTPPTNNPHNADGPIASSSSHSPPQASQVDVKANGNGTTNAPTCFNKSPIHSPTPAPTITPIPSATTHTSSPSHTPTPLSHTTHSRVSTAGHTANSVSPIDITDDDDPIDRVRRAQPAGAELWRHHRARPETAAISSSSSDVATHFTSSSNSTTPIMNLPYRASPVPPTPIAPPSPGTLPPAVIVIDNVNHNGNDNNVDDVMTMPVPAFSQRRATTAAPPGDRKLNQHPTWRPRNKRALSASAAVPGGGNGARGVTGNNVGMVDEGGILFGLPRLEGEVAPTLLDIHRRHIRHSDYESRVQRFCESIRPYRAPEGQVVDYYYSLRALETKGRVGRGDGGVEVQNLSGGMDRSGGSGEKVPPSCDKSKPEVSPGETEMNPGYAPVRMRSLTLKNLRV